MVVDLYCLAGQSNAQGNGDSSLSPDPSAGNALEYDADANTINDPLNDPISHNSQDAETGSLAPSFCVEYYNRLDRTVAIVGAANGATAQTTECATANSSGSLHWDTDGSLQGDAVTFVNNAISELENAGYNVDFKGILWLQGEQDAGCIDDGNISKSLYKETFKQMISDFRSDLNRPEMPFWIIQIGQLASGDTTGFQEIRAAQSEVANEVNNAFMVSTIQKDFPSSGRQTNEYHYTQEGYNDSGVESATNLAQTLKTDFTKGSYRTKNGSVQTSGGSKELAIQG